MLADPIMKLLGNTLLMTQRTSSINFLEVKRSITQKTILNRLLSIIIMGPVYTVQSYQTDNAFSLLQALLTNI
ncbi:hypothetical protein PR048_028351 [Dryococelus australis]|uniref:Uncharacterized protein n=1 Tax=Dryococelus australis TaxID=614101 RepID=A0ABQ9GJ28_9NEOP|nr:hypothetical protein PR048_028351 [Dryococelus australis]